MSTSILCSNCRQPYPETGIPYHCQTCGGLYDYAHLPIFDPSQIQPGLTGIWRYKQALGMPDDAPMVSLGEGNTPLIASELFGRQVALKCEYLNPSGSFKDRGSALLASFLLSRGVTDAVEDSSGNAGASFAAYAARAGMKARIFVPDSASGPKRAQIEAYGAELVSIPGPRSNAAEAVRKAADSGAAYASHAYMPFNLLGYATAAYEIVEQLGEGPGTVLVPIGQGGFVLGLVRGFKALYLAGVIPEMPRMVGVQARACAPIWAVASYGLAGLSFVAEGETLAEGIRVLRPLRGDVVLREVEQHGGTFLSVDEAEIVTGRAELAKRGFYVEYTSAVVWAALSQLSSNPQIHPREPIVMILTGSGLKNK